MKEEFISRATFDHLVDLAALELDESQAEYLRRELNLQLSAVHELEAIPLDPDVHPTSHGVPYTDASRPALRPDRWQPYPHPEDILEQTPETNEGYIVVPDIPHTTLE